MANYITTLDNNKKVVYNNHRNDIVVCDIVIHKKSQRNATPLAFVC